MLDFLGHERVRDEAVALVDAATGVEWRYARLRDVVARAAAAIPAGPARGVALVLVRRDVPSLLAYLAALRAGHAVLPLEADLDPALVAGLVDRYAPELVLGGEGARWSPADDATYGPEAPLAGQAWVRRRLGSPVEPPVAPGVALLLSTSGSTGSPKLVRLTARNVMANADGIRVALRIDESARAVTSLAFSYSFGLSVVHSHLLAGATLVVADGSVMTPEFWAQVRAHGVTSFSGVPYTYEIMRRIGFQKMELPALRTLAQAGGRLAPEHVLHYHELMAARGGEFVTMYGQTEATARITVLPPELLPAKLGSVGRPMPGGRIRVRRLDAGGELPPGEVGELVYEGPNVMLGYAETRDDLARGDDLGGVLATGDSGYVDADGCVFITGRLKRFAKLYGLRVSLDDLEARLSGHGPVVALDGGDRVVVCCAPDAEAGMRAATAALAQQLQVNARSFIVRPVEAFPLLPNGKVDYRALATLAAG